MKLARFFFSQLFARKPFIVLCIFALIFMVNYIAFSTSRAIFSTMEGRSEIAKVLKDGSFIANLDPGTSPNFDRLTDEALNVVYSHIDPNYSYAVYTDGLIASIDNDQSLDVTVSYTNEKYNEINGFPISDGNELDFNYDLDSPKPDEIPVLVGAGLASEYPVGTSFTMQDPALGHPLKLKVAGVIDKNASHSNFYALDSKQYYNFSLVLPITLQFIEESDATFKFTALNDMIITDTDRSSAEALRSHIFNTIGVNFNFYSRSENVEFFKEHFGQSMLVLLSISTFLTVFVLISAVWSSLLNLRLMISDFTINLLVGLSYSRLKSFFYLFYGLLAASSLVCITAITAYSRFEAWRLGDPLFMTMGTLKLIYMDWLSLAVVLVLNCVIVISVSQLSTWRVKSIPISVGVIQ